MMGLIVLFIWIVSIGCCRIVTVLALSSSSSSSNIISSPRIFLVTGATDGIGRHTAQKIASDGHGVLIHGRKSKKEVTGLISDLQDRGAAFVHYFQYDLSDLEQVKEFAYDVERTEGVDYLNVLINNAGVFDPTPRFSKQGYDMTWAVNVMAPFVLTRYLLPMIARGNTEAGGDDVHPRIIITSSISQSSSLPKFSQLFAKEGENNKDSSGRSYYSAHSAYSYSKLGDLMITVKLAELLKATNNPNLSTIKCLTMDPGTVNTKMLLAGWGPCGIPVRKADNTYKLAATKFGAEQPSGSYHFGGSAASDSKDSKKLDALWEALETHTGCTYKDILFS